MSVKKHIVGKEQLEITIPDQATGISMQNSISEIVKYRLNPALDHLFTKISSSEETVRIDKLVVDLGSIAPSDIGQRFVPEVVKEIEAEINELLSAGDGKNGVHVNGKSSKTNGRQHATSGYQTSLGSGEVLAGGARQKKGSEFSAGWDNLSQAGGEKDKARAKILSRSQQVLEQFIYFLRNGRFSWWQGSSANTDTSEILSEALQCDRKSLQHQLIPNFKNETVRTRLLYQFKESQVDDLLTRIDQKGFNRAKNVFELIRSSVKLAAVQEALTSSFYQSYMHRLAQGIKIDQESHIAKLFEDIISDAIGSFQEELREKVLIEILSGASSQKGSTVSKEEKRLAQKSGIGAALKLRVYRNELKQLITSIPTGNDQTLRGLISRFLDMASEARKETGSGITDEKASIEKPGLPEELDDSIADAERGISEPKRLEESRDQKEVAETGHLDADFDGSEKNQESQDEDVNGVAKPGDKVEGGIQSDEKNIDVAKESTESSIKKDSKKPDLSTERDDIEATDKKNEQTELDRQRNENDSETGELSEQREDTEQQSKFAEKDRSDVPKPGAKSTESEDESQADKLKTDEVSKSSGEKLSRDDAEATEAEKQPGQRSADSEFADLISPFPPRVSDDAEPIMVSNAGLVIFHPFLQFLFEGLELLESDSGFKSLEQALKAVHLLQYIATGEDSAPEDNLSLNKVLCGLDISEPVPREGRLTKEEKEECNHLVQTVLQRWEALKTSNVDALRGTYLLREGLLKPSGPGWSLNIERTPFDVMLEKLPWGISIIKFPWSTKLLYVEW